MLLLRSKTKVVKKFTICLKSNWLETRDGFTSQLTWFISKLRSPPSTFLFHEWIWKDYRPIWVLDRVHFRHPTFRRVPVRIQWTPAALCQNTPWHDGRQRERKIRILDDPPAPPPYRKRILRDGMEKLRQLTHDEDVLTFKWPNLVTSQKVSLPTLQTTTLNFQSFNFSNWFDSNNPVDHIPCC